MIMLFIAGLVSGTVSGMGIGGGVILIPILTFFFNIGQKTAQFINLLYFVPVAVCALIIHAKNKRLNYKAALYTAITGAAGALFSSFAVMRMSGGGLRKHVGVFLLIIGLSQFKKVRKQK